MDAFAVSICFAAAAGGKLPAKTAFVIAGFFGLFQAVMTMLGYYAGEAAYKYIEAYDHWIAFGILLLIGLKMIKDSFSSDENSPVSKYTDPTDLKLLTVLAFATSIDAFAVGVSISCRHISILKPAIIIGAVTFIISLIGCFLGSKFERIFRGKAELLGGIVLILIAAKVLLEH